MWKYKDFGKEDTVNLLAPASRCFWLLTIGSSEEIE